MQISSEQDILDQGVRIKIIEEIKGSENKARKDEMYKRYAIYKDRTYNYVLEKMLLLFEQSTVAEMSYAISNISLERKVIEKLARVYAQGCTRAVMTEDDKEDDKLTEQVNEISKVLSLNTKMKKTNRAYKRDKNTLLYVKPFKVLEDGAEKFDLDVCPLFPFLYDVVEDPEQKEKPLCVILSHYAPPSVSSSLPVQNEVQAGIHGNATRLLSFSPPGDKRDQSIADTPEDSGSEKRQYIWWSNEYHFTTNEKGEVTSEDLDNPIGVLPFINFAEDQDGAFWAQGGEDLVNGAILVNSLVSHMNHIAVVQGYGQFYMTGKNLPKGMKIGPSRGIRIEVETKDDPQPQLGFLQANPPLADLKANIEMYVALLLTTNNLSVSGVATQLGNAQSPAAGISLIIDKAESMEDVNDQQQIFHDNEPVMWRLIAKWINYFKSKKLMVEDLAKFELPEDLEVKLKFPEPRPIMTEKEKLENIQLRQDMGLNTQAELLMMDDPNLSKDQALEKLKEIAKEKAEKMAQMAEDMMNGNQGDQGNGQPNPDNQQPGIGPDGNPKKPADGGQGVGG